MKCLHDAPRRVGCIENISFSVYKARQTKATSLKPCGVYIIIKM